MTNLVCVSDYEKWARKSLSMRAEGYVSYGAEEGVTLRDNVEAYKRIRLRPRMLRNVKNRDMNTSLLGNPVSLPIGISPTSFHALFCPDGETATAKAAANIGCCYVMSSSATSSVETIADATPSSLKWFQVYIFKNRDITKKISRRAAEAGFKALVYTIDSPVHGKGKQDISPSHLEMPMWPTDGKTFAGDAIDPSVTWKDIWWLKKESGLPVVVKGLLTAEDTELAIQHGADAVYVSNHGGRQLETVRATIDVLPEVVAAARGRVEVYLDGGIRTGTDVFKALALGARAVFLGRPIIWGLACKEQEGAKEVLSLLKQELSAAMALTGCRTIAEINSDYVQVVSLL